MNLPFVSNLDFSEQHWHWLICMSPEGRNKEAVLLLERYLRQWADDSLHIKLAQVFAATNLLSDALSHYQSALRYTSPWS